MNLVAPHFNTTGQDLESADPRVRIGRGEEHTLFREGQRVIVGDEELEVEATLEFERDRDVWWACPDWSTRHTLPGATISDYNSRVA